MYTIEYDIKLDDRGRPYIHLPKDYEHRPEDRFFAIEITRYVLQKSFSNNSGKFDVETNEQIKNTINLLGQVSDEMAQILFENMKVYGQTAFILNRPYHIIVDTIDYRPTLPHVNNIVISG